jgi:molybdopterin converting factor small subunit
MNIRLVAYGIAKEILGGAEVEYSFSDGNTTGALKDSLQRDFPDFARLVSLRLAVDVDYVEDSFVLNENDEVVIIPPVSGG